MPDKRDMHKAKSKGRHRPGGQSGAGSARSAGGDPIAGTDASGPAAGAMPGKKNDGRR